MRQARPVDTGRNPRELFVRFLDDRAGCKLVMRGDCFVANQMDAVQLRLFDFDRLPPMMEPTRSVLPDVRRTVNVVNVRKLSPFRYPGGKTWLVPIVRDWLMTLDWRPSVFVEPFAGGASVGLSIAADNLADRVVLVELDDDVAAVWKTVFCGSDADVAWLIRAILDFDVTRENVIAVLSSEPISIRERAFRTIVRNRMQYGGIMTRDAGLVKHGENGKGLSSRWYPRTLAKRIDVLRQLRDRIEFRHGDGFEAISQYRDDADAIFFIDPPYTAGGKNPGKRLYVHSMVDHERLFAVTEEVRGTALLTYDESDKVLALADRFGFFVSRVPMKNRHHAVVDELLIIKGKKCETRKTCELAARKAQVDKVVSAF